MIEIKKFLLPVALQLLGVIVVIAEVIVPSGGILAIVACGVFAYSLYIVFTDISTFAGGIFLIADVICIPVLIIVGLKLLAKSPVTLRKTLSKEEGVTSQSPSLESYLGKEGITVTNLRPSGVAIIDDQRVDVISRGEYIEKNSTIVVHSVTANQIIVRKKEEI